MSEKDIELQMAYCCEVAQQVAMAEEQVRIKQRSLACEQGKFADMLRVFRKHLVEQE